MENAELHVAKLINEEFKKEQIDIISEKPLVDALELFVDKEENDALSEYVVLIFPLLDLLLFETDPPKLVSKNRNCI